MTTEMTDPQLIATVAARVAAAVESLDLERVRSVYTTDACVWHNLDNREKTVDESLEFLGGLAKACKRIWYEDIRLTPTPDGYVEQHMVRSVLINDQEIATPVCMVVTLEGDLVKRLDEYIDGSAIAPTLAALDG